MSARFSSLAFAGAALVGIAAIGAGAAATFTASSSSTQTITAGTLTVTSSSTAEGASCTHVDTLLNCDTITGPEVGPVNSSFETDPIRVTLENPGTLEASYDAIQISAPTETGTPSRALRNQMSVCILVSDPVGGERVVANGPLTAAITGGVSLGSASVVIPDGYVGSDYWYEVTYYAGQIGFTCGGEGAPSYTAPSLSNNAMGGVVTPTLTIDFSETD